MGDLPRFWIWMQILIVAFVLAGAIIAITRL
jgi:ABC-type multidrug transport system permease subunit